MVSVPVELILCWLNYYSTILMCIYTCNINLLLIYNVCGVPPQISNPKQQFSINTFVIAAGPQPTVDKTGLDLQEIWRVTVHVWQWINCLVWVRPKCTWLVQAGSVKSALLISFIFVWWSYRLFSQCAPSVFQIRSTEANLNKSKLQAEVWSVRLKSSPG